MDFKKLSNIKECRLFSHFSDHDIQELLSSGFASVKSYLKEDLLFSEGEYCDFLSVVIEGKIEIQKLDSNGNILVVATLNRGNVFGENLLFGDRNFYPMSVVAKENSQVLHIKKDYIYKLCSSNEPFLRELLRILSNKALNLSSKLKQVTMKSIREMICNYLLKKYNKEKSTTIKLEFSRKDWADKLGVQRPSLSRELMKMRDAGLIDFSKNIIEIKDLEGLKSNLL
ncbi:Crp/Fnr family transcriptional regulator [Clostridium perfringens]|uniref:Crp/Fnr family transcriptional regulator n=1 Tax=Clostridium perfringens TaxID=1502 RepID=UPI001094B42E|nr:Crp/Fnr family transcriptional regulator [Clostridium perfringens]EGT0012580.1 Crp/Fnr family transcriptional regulator [Clostridium perfringens]EIW6614723.1 Crp/Fnr family transcriptional regulator [Clostridium perfringens]ELC8425016.1 Crp/Fnr family transcriptional regulator [Clostridium perfringens]ELQ0172584.1 Crp/Fnr family transcriptional regulator [Clostridium perfringens]ELU5587967.1 Crp/Fnr family transcriptional regulator [Clostridium perfringens]